MGGECGCESSTCCHGQLHGRRFLTKEEKIKQLENYVEELKKEIAAVLERIEELKSKTKHPMNKQIGRTPNSLVKLVFSVVFSERLRF